MAKLTQFEDANPIYSGRTPTDEGKGYDAIAQVFGNVAESAKKQTLDLLDEQSQVGMLQAKTAMNQAHIRAQIDLIHNPDLADDIRNNYKRSIDDITQNSIVNDRHRKELEATGSVVNGQIELAAAQTQQKSLVNNTKIAINTEFPHVLRMIDDFYRSGNMKQANDLIDDLVRTSNMALKIGAMTPKEYDTWQALTSETLNNAKRTLLMLGKGDATARDLHEASNTIYGNNQVNGANLPSNEYTNANTQYYDEESTKQKVLSDVDTYGHITDIHELDNLTADAKDQVFLHWQGANRAIASINSGTDQISINSRVEELKAKPTLSIQETGELNYYKSYYNRLANGNFISEMQKTSQGQRIQQAAIDQERGIQNNAQLDANQKLIQQRQNKEKEKMAYLNLWNGLHGDPKYVNLMTPEELAPVVNAFNFNADPSTAISALRGTDPAFIPYIADSMPTAQQRAVVSIVGQAGENLTRGLAYDMIQGNQTGFKAKILTPDKEVSSIKKVQSLIAVNQDVAGALSYLNYLPHDPKEVNGKGMSASSGAIEALSNTVLFQADRARDYNLTNVNGYISSLGVNMAKAYSIYTDTNVVFNRSTLKLEDQQLAKLGAYAKTQAYEKLQTQMPTLKFLDIMDRQPLMVINTPNNMIAVIDATTKKLAMGKDGKPLFYAPYTNSMLQASHHAHNLNKVKQYEKFHQSLPFEATMRDQLQLGKTAL